MGLKLVFWGSRGAISSPGTELLEFGGYTPCVTLEADSGELLILDAGFGLSHYSENIKRPNQEYSLLFSHFHWDHIQGMGAFFPIFIPATTINFYSAYEIQMMQDALDMYFDGSYGPFNGFRSMPAKLLFHKLKKKQPINGFEVEIFELNHNDPCYAFKIQKEGKTVVYAANHEVGKSKNHIENNKKFLQFCRNCDILIHDAMYTEEEYQKKVGWGHSSMEGAVKNGIAAGVKKLILFYHEPLRNDRELAMRETDFQLANKDREIQIEFAREQKVYHL